MKNLIKGTAFTPKASLKPAVRTALVNEINLPAVLPDYDKLAPNKVYKTFKDESGNEFYAVITLIVTSKDPLEKTIQKDTEEVVFID